MAKEKLERHDSEQRVNRHGNEPSRLSIAPVDSAERVMSALPDARRSEAAIS